MPAAAAWRRVWEISIIIVVYTTFARAHYYYLSVLILPMNALFVWFANGWRLQLGKLMLAVVAYLLLSTFVLPVSVFSWALRTDAWALYLRTCTYLFGELLLLGLLSHEYLRMPTMEAAQAERDPGRSMPPDRSLGRAALQDTARS